MEDLKKSLYKMGIKSQSAGPWVDLSEEQRGKFHDGVCPACGVYDTEMDPLGFCRDIECRRDRLTAALKSGEAMMNRDGTLVWAPGVKIRKAAK